MIKSKRCPHAGYIGTSITILIAVVFCVFSQGCASTKLPHTYRIEGREYSDFKGLSDEEALKAVVMTYNVPTQGRAEEIAKALTLQEQLEKLEKRKTEYIISSGVFEQIVFEAIDLKLWLEADLIKTYNELREKSARDSGFRSLSEAENAKKIVYVIGMQRLVNELERRENKKKTGQIVSRLLSTAMSVAVSLI
jgi:hypothetical protein